VLANTLCDMVLMMPLQILREACNDPIIQDHKAIGDWDDQSVKLL